MVIISPQNMDLVSCKYMQQSFQNMGQKQEIESFVVRIYRHNLIKDGRIIKKKLREKLLEDIRLRRITRVKIDQLGWVLANHGLITHNRLKQLNTPEHEEHEFKFNMERLRYLFEEHEHRLNYELTVEKRSLKAIINAALAENEKALKDIQALLRSNQPLAKIKHIITIGRMGKFDVQQSLHFCFVCRLNFVTSELYAIHFETTHEESFKMGLENECFATEQKLDVVQHYDALSPVTLFTIRNASHKSLHITGVYLYHITKQLISVNPNVWPITIDPSDSYKFSITTGMFLATEHDYTILVQFNRILEYVEQYHFRIIRAPVELKMTQAPIIFRNLPEYFPSSDVVTIFKNNFRKMETYTSNERELIDKIESFLESNSNSRLNSTNYVKMLQLMNNIEDVNMQRELSKYDMCDVTLSPCKTSRFYSLRFDQFRTAPNSLVEGDYVEFSNKLTKTIFGTISQLCTAEVIFETEKPIPENLKWRLHIRPNRIPFRMEYQALDIVERHELSSFFFPTNTIEKSKTYSSDQFEWFNRNMTDNEEQKTAVMNIVNETASPAPFILFGPPGTGKTSTLVEAVAQIWKLKPNACILITASSNFACNELTERLLNVIPKQHILRFFSKRAERQMADMSYRIIGCSNLKTGTYLLPSYGELYQKRIIICTLISAGKLVQADIAPNHFNYVFIDECGSATEASALVPIAGIISTLGNINGSVILSGDPMQLGPVIRSEFAGNMGLRISMLERLMNLPVYEKDPVSKCYNNNLIIKLLKNYRSHEAILRFSNKCFYRNELQACAMPDNVNWALNWPELPALQFPIIFESTIGKFSRDPDSSSYFNQNEIELVKFYIRRILLRGINKQKVHQQSIGVISPYKKQCIMLKQMFDQVGWQNIDVGSVEAFQGREKPIIIFTTVRSGTNGVGFLDNVKRLNVAITRAKALLIVIGNPQTLQQDPNWLEFLRYCHSAKAIRGVKFELDNQNLVVQETTSKDGQSNYNKIDHLVDLMTKLKL